jgi:hypothetical protein
MLLTGDGSAAHVSTSFQRAIAVHHSAKPARNGPLRTTDADTQKDSSKEIRCTTASIPNGVAL